MKVFVYSCDFGEKITGLNGIKGIERKCLAQISVFFSFLFLSDLMGAKCKTNKFTLLLIEILIFG